MVATIRAQVMSCSHLATIWAKTMANNRSHGPGAQMSWQLATARAERPDAMLATDASMPPGGPRVRLAYLDALRGLAILGVLIVHFSLWLKPAGEAEKGLMGNGAFGVQLFYVVSAFTICMSLAADRGPGALQRFFTRRFFRIAPMFWVAIILSLTLWGLLPRYAAPDGIAPWAVVATFLMAHGLHPESINSVVFGGWSVGVEVMFYALAPMLFLRIATI
jgi:peptidoglycan/LPS O-acetylase OafA/YrhL